MSEQVKLTLEGKSIITRKDTLIFRSSYFNSILSGIYKSCFNKRKNRYNINIDRSYNAFLYVLNFLRDDRYKVPEKYIPELDFFGITYTKDNIEYDKTNNMIKEIENLKKDLQKLKSNQLLSYNTNILHLNPINCMNFIEFPYGNNGYCEVDYCSNKIICDCGGCNSHCICYEYCTYCGEEEQGMICIHCNLCSFHCNCN